MSEQRFDCGDGMSDPKKMRSKILACLNGRPQKVDMRRLVQNSLRVYWNATTTVLLTNSCPAATRFLRTPIKADTNFLGRILFRGEHAATTV